MKMTKAFRMTPDVIRVVVEKGRMGAYVLGDVVNGRFSYAYVGRSECCLQNRLLTHPLLYHYPYFIFSYAGSAKEAFELESKWWHDCRNSGFPLLNAIHPASPSGTALTCPYCQFYHAVKEYLPRRKAG